jgi:hypothetical protein
MGCLHAAAKATEAAAPEATEAATAAPSRIANTGPAVPERVILRPFMPIRLLSHWQRVAKLILAHANVFAVSRALELALFIDAKLDVSKVPAQ